MPIDSPYGDDLTAWKAADALAGPSATTWPAEWQGHDHALTTLGGEPVMLPVPDCAACNEARPGPSGDALSRTLAEARAFDAGTHIPAVDDFGNQYLARAAVPSDGAGGADRDALYRRIHALPQLAHHGKGEACFPITDAVLAALRSTP